MDAKNQGAGRCADRVRFKALTKLGYPPPFGGVAQTIMKEDGIMDDSRLRRLQPRLDHHPKKLKSSFVITFGFTVIMIKHNLSLFISYLDFLLT